MAKKNYKKLTLSREQQEHLLRTYHANESVLGDFRCNTLPDDDDEQRLMRSLTAGLCTELKCDEWELKQALDDLLIDPVAWVAEFMTSLEFEAAQRREVPPKDIPSNPPQSEMDQMIAGLKLPFARPATLYMIARHRRDQVEVSMGALGKDGGPIYDALSKIVRILAERLNPQPEEKSESSHVDAPNQEHLPLKNENGGESDPETHEPSESE